MLQQLTAVAFDVAAISPGPQLRALLSRWRSGGVGAVGGSGAAGLAGLQAELVRQEFDGYLAQRAGDNAAHRAAFRRARALHCLQFAVADQLPPEQRLAEAAYEAMVVMGDPAGVAGILTDFTP